MPEWGELGMDLPRKTYVGASLCGDIYVHQAGGGVDAVALLVDVC